MLMFIISLFVISWFIGLFTPDNYNENNDLDDCTKMIMFDFFL